MKYDLPKILKCRNRYEVFIKGEKVALSFIYIFNSKEYLI